MSAYTLLGAIAATVTITLGLSRLWDWYWDIRQKTQGRITWKQVEKGTKELIKSIRDDNFQPEVVVGLGRGGSIIGALLSGNLGGIPFTAVDRTYEWDGHRRIVSILDIGCLNLEGKKTLLTIAEPYTGETAKLAFEYLQSKKPSDLRVASLCRSTMTTFLPHYYAFPIKSVRHFPWRIDPAYPVGWLAPSERS